MVNEIFPEDAFAALGCVISPRNVAHIPDVIRFASEIGWWVSLVPAHATANDRPMSFRTFDRSLEFGERDFGQVDALLDTVERMKHEGANLYDSKEYLADVRRFLKRQPVRWRDRNGGVCDSPHLYFAIRPDGGMAVCCDLRMKSHLSTAAPDFPDRYFDYSTRDEVHGIAAACTGCLFGSFPEITISARYFGTMVQRAVLFNGKQRRTLKKLTAEQMFDIAAGIRARNPDAYGRSTSTVSLPIIQV
jgi:hypothetical protein